MKYTRLLFIAIFILTGMAGCNIVSPTSDEDPPESSGTVFLWIGADKDAYVSCGRPSGNCPEQDLNFGQEEYLSVAFSSVAIKRVYVHFLIPELPDGTEIQEAYLELYHPGKNEDGKTDDINIPVVRAVSDWSPLDITYATQPNSFPASYEFELTLNSQYWSGSTDIVTIVREIFNNPEAYHGFVLYWDEQSLGIEKGFYSNNYIDRTADDLAQSPRLLVKIRLLDGKTNDDISLPPIPTDNDLEFSGQEVLMMRYAGGEDFPESWNVTKGIRQ